MDSKQFSVESAWARTEVMWHSSLPYLTQHHEASLKSQEGQRSTGKMSGGCMDSRISESAEGSLFPSSLSTSDYQVAYNCHTFNSHQITSPQLLILMSTMRIEIQSTLMPGIM